VLYNFADIGASLRPKGVTLLWLAFAIAPGGCHESSPSPITGATSSSGAGGISVTAGAPATAGAGPESVRGAAGDGRPIASGAGAGGIPRPAGPSGAAGTSTSSDVAGGPAAVGGAGPAGAGASGGAATAGAGGGATGAAGASFPPVSDLGMNGPYTAMTVNSTGPGGTYTIYRPSELAPGGAKNPIVGWMSGGGSTPSMYTLLPHLATHGFVVVASNTSPALGEEEALGKEILAGIDWLLAENAKSDSAYHDKLDPTKIASMGYSMGALATTMIAGDPRLTTTVHISGGNMMTDRIKMLHAPAAFLCGASGVDIAGANCATDFDAATAPVFYGVFNGGDHLGVRTQPYADRIRLVVTGWLRWQLMRDASLAPMFVGDQCTVCKDSNWTVKQKNLM
jgi:dienelactone hydrolase